MRVVTYLDPILATVKAIFQLANNLQNCNHGNESSKMKTETEGMRLYLNATKNGLINQRFVATPLLIFFLLLGL